MARLLLWPPRSISVRVGVEDSAAVEEARGRGRETEEGGGGWEDAEGEVREGCEAHSEVERSSPAASLRSRMSLAICCEINRFSSRKLSRSMSSFFRFRSRRVGSR